MKKLLIRVSLAAFVLFFITISTQAEEYLIPVGKVVGLELAGDSVTVAAFDDTLAMDAKAAGLRIGDEILAIDGMEVSCAQDVRRALNHSDGSVELLLSRNGDTCQVRVKPSVTAEGPRLGIYLRQGVTGIGTVTFYDPETDAFGTLGHGVHDAKGELARMTAGRVYDAEIVYVKKGVSGEPGQLKGKLDADRLLGSLSRNTVRGVFGAAQNAWEGEAIPVATCQEVHTGPAVIRSTVTGDSPREYSVEILKIYPKTRTDGRNMLIRVTDPALLETTGGIVQGMSGSPIIQDGKLVGAVTHVLVNSPDTGYGIFIENMLDAAA